MSKMSKAEEMEFKQYIESIPLTNEDIKKISALNKAEFNRIGSDLVRLCRAYALGKASAEGKDE